MPLVVCDIATPPRIELRTRRPNILEFAPVPENGKVQVRKKAGMCAGFKVLEEDASQDSIRMDKPRIDKAAPMRATMRRTEHLHFEGLPNLRRGTAAQFASRESSSGRDLSRGVLPGLRSQVERVMRAEKRSQKGLAAVSHRRRGRARLGQSREWRRRNDRDVSICTSRRMQWQYA